jgi:hypothetical protein
MNVSPEETLRRAVMLLIGHLDATGDGYDGPIYSKVVSNLHEDNGRVGRITSIVRSLGRLVGIERTLPTTEYVRLRFNNAAEDFGLPTDETE